MVATAYAEEWVVVTKYNPANSSIGGSSAMATRTRKDELHGYVGTTTYKAWGHMLGRCRNPNNLKWSRYGGRGITVCNRWLWFSNFLADMGEKPEGTLLDRIDNDGNYEPGNCQWSTPKESSNNRIQGQAKLTTAEREEIKLKSRTKLQVRLAKEYGVSKSTICRIVKNA